MRLWRRRRRLDLTIPGRVHITYDPTVDALYVQFRSIQGRPLRTVEVCQHPLVNLDLDGDLPTGFEVLW